MTTIEGLALNETRVSKDCLLLFMHIDKTLSKWRTIKCVVKRNTIKHFHLGMSSITVLKMEAIFLVTCTYIIMGLVRRCIP